MIGDAVIGDDCRVLQGVTIGRADFNGSSYPVLGDRVTVYAGAVIVGPVTIGDDAVIGANAVVTRDVPAGATLGGIPARLLHVDDAEADRPADVRGGELAGR